MNNVLKIPTFSTIFRTISYKNEIIGASSFHSSSVYHAGSAWRRRNGMPANHNAYGPMTDLPDYTFIDGRPTPPGTGRIKRALQQREITKKIIELTSEVDSAVSRHMRLQKEEEERKANILARKLKPKGTRMSSGSV